MDIQRIRPMGVGDMVRVAHLGENLSRDRRNVGFIVKVDRSTMTKKIRYWVRLLGGWRVGPFPFTARQLEIISEGG